MVCQAQPNRPVQHLSIAMDEELLARAEDYCSRHGVYMRTLVEAALVNFIYAQMEPAPMKVCSTHGVVMEHNSSGTAVACPVNEGSDTYFQLGGQTPSDGDDSSRYKPERAVLYDGTPGSGSINNKK